MNTVLYRSTEGGVLTSYSREVASTVERGARGGGNLCTRNTRCLPPDGLQPTVRIRHCLPRLSWRLTVPGTVACRCCALRQAALPLSTVYRYTSDHIVVVQLTLHKRQVVRQFILDWSTQIFKKEESCIDKRFWIIIPLF